MQGFFLREMHTLDALRFYAVKLKYFFRGSCSHSASCMFHLQKHKPLKTGLAVANSILFSSELLDQNSTGLEWGQVAQKVYLLPK